MFVHTSTNSVRFRLLSGHLFGKICPISRFGFDGRILVLIALVPGHCLLDTFFHLHS